MRWMSNRERAKRGYHEIVALAKGKISHWILKNAHAAKGIEKVVMFPKVLWQNGTYVLKLHGKLKV